MDTICTNARFQLGRLLLTPGALHALEESEQSAFEFLSRQVRGDWGDLTEADKQENELSVQKGYRLLSAYHTNEGAKLWVITEADRSATTLLLPDEY